MLKKNSNPKLNKEIEVLTAELAEQTSRADTALLLLRYVADMSDIYVPEELSEAYV